MRRFDRLRRTGFLATLLLSPALSQVGCLGFGPSDPSPGLQPAFIDVSSGDRQTGAAGARLHQEVVALVRLETGGPSPGDVAPDAQVVWTVTGGGGTVDPAVSTTDANGLARAAWTLGTEPGQQKLVARIQGFVSVHVPEAEFTAMAVPVDGWSGAGGATGAGGGAGGNPGTGGTPVDGFRGMGGMTGTGGAPGTGGTPVDGFRGMGGMTGVGGSNAPGTGGSSGGSTGGGPGGADTGTSPGSGGAGAGGMTGSGGSDGAGPTCAARCIRDGSFCQCTVIPGECAQLFQVVCPSGAAASCTCKVNGAVTASFPGTALCDPTLLNAATACGFSLVIPN